MRQGFTEPGSVHRQEMDALKDRMRLEIIEFIGREVRRLQEIGSGLGLSDEELKDQVASLEGALLVEIEDDLCRLTPRCIAYLDQIRGYEWKR